MDDYKECTKICRELIKKYRAAETEVKITIQKILEYTTERK